MPGLRDIDEGLYVGHVFGAHDCCCPKPIG
jgi:hypothetical protein